MNVSLTKILFTFFTVIATELLCFGFYTSIMTPIVYVVGAVAMMVCLKRKCTVFLSLNIVVLLIATYVLI